MYDTSELQYDYILRYQMIFTIGHVPCIQVYKYFLVYCIIYILAYITNTDLANMICPIHDSSFFSYVFMDISKNSVKLIEKRPVIYIMIHIALKLLSCFLCCSISGGKSILPNFCPIQDTILITSLYYFHLLWHQQKGDNHISTEF